MKQRRRKLSFPNREMIPLRLWRRLSKLPLLQSKAGNVPPVPVTYTILDGANGTWTKGSTEGHSAPFSKFVSVKVDGAEGRQGHIAR